MNRLGQHAESHFSTGYCSDCKKLVELLVNTFEQGTTFVCQECGKATVAKRKEQHGKKTV